MYHFRIIFHLHVSFPYNYLFKVIIRFIYMYMLKHVDQSHSVSKFFSSLKMSTISSYEHIIIYYTCILYIGHDINSNSIHWIVVFKISMTSTKRKESKKGGHLFIESSMPKLNGYVPLSIRAVTLYRNLTPAISRWWL